ncbi:ABC transporter ATP-binding protein [Nocardioides bizhenqiangii]|uniref:ABC transporter ATP-binding protein n=1 Tax=Nocardioides bizhenqiangii TaxID=3095076 RepID=A0ABZ0ZMX4_9ACTN|nr:MULTISPECIES: ABC transporter ATP-binding protein [unclassified Nocardioides]MDZ5621553.1 ABC transporter ATP-binding protein [Nocardioides sp. HM23]WQQ25610.1 ABC transporter ATP-binding protein [Nocardioides sp. HM61]
MRLEIKGLTKKFGSFTANDRIDLVVEPGEIHCLLGENGAGKSTLMNMLYGLLTPTEGEILLDGKPVSFDGPGDALAAGVGMVHQHFMLVPVFTVTENVMLGHEQTYGPGVLNRRAARKQVQDLSDRYRLHVNPDALIEDIPVGVQQRVEIIKALASHAKILILDEPTAVLTPQEIDELMAIMRELKAQGTSIIFITHKLREVKAIGDRISVIRRGKVVGTAEPSASEAELAEMMVGRSVSLVVDKEPATPGAPVLKADGITVIDPRGHVVVKDVSFEARAGEVLGIAGVQGNGQTELIKSLLGLVRPDAGRIELDGKDISRHGPRQSLEDGIGYIPEDRSHDGFVGAFSVRENLVLDLYRSDEFSKGPALRLDTIAANAKHRIDEFDIRTESAESPVASLSGGNQQKVVVAREFSRPLKVLIASQPTRGVDVGSIEFIHKRIISERDKGTAVVIVSTELEEIYALADRIAVMYDGRIVATVTPDIPREQLGLLMAGAVPEGTEVAS